MVRLRGSIKDSFRKAFDNFDIKKIANYDENKIQALLEDKSIIRNQRKIRAVVYNANQVLKIQAEFESFKNWLVQHKAHNLEEWTLLFRENFKFTGKLIVEEFLMSIGLLKGAHKSSCPVFEKMTKVQKEWKNC